MSLTIIYINLFTIITINYHYGIKYHNVSKFCSVKFTNRSNPSVPTLEKLNIYYGSKNRSKVPFFIRRNKFFMKMHFQNFPRNYTVFSRFPFHKPRWAIGLSEDFFNNCKGLFKKKRNFNGSAGFRRKDCQRFVR